MTVEYIAHSAFRLTAPSGAAFLVDPYVSGESPGYAFPPDLAPVDAALLSHPHPDHDAGHAAGRAVPWGEQTAVLTSPGRFIFEGAVVRGVRGRQAIHAAAGAPGAPAAPGENTVWVFESGGLRIAHLGDNAPVTGELAEAIGTVDLLMVPVDDAERILAHEDVERYREMLEPRVTIPMHYRIAGPMDDTPDPGAPGSIEGWLARQEGVRHLGTHVIAVTPDDLPDAPAIWVFEPSPSARPPGR